MAIMLAVAAVYLFPFTRLLHRIGDEGTIVYGAQQVLEGAVPYRDFVEVMGPGSFYWLALFFKMFGDSWHVSRLCLWVTGVGTTLLFYWIARQFLNRYAALIAWLFFAVVSIPLWPAPNHHLDSNLFALSAVAIFILWLRTPRIIWLAVAGFLAGITSCFIQPKGLYLLAAFALMIFIHGRKVGAIKAVAVLSGCYIAVGIVLLILFHLVGAAHDLIYCTFLWPMSGYHAVNSGIYWQSTFAAMQPASLYVQVFPHGLGLVCLAICLIPFLLLAALPVAAAIGGALLAWKRAFTSLPILLLPALAIWLSEMHRKDLYHLAYGSPLLIIVGVELLYSSFSRQVRNVFLSIAALALVLIALGDLWNTRGGYPIHTRRGIVLDAAPDDALVFLNTAVPRNEQVFVYPYYPMYYYLADVRNPTRFSILMYHYNTREQFDEVIRDLESKRVKFALWDTVVDGANLRTWFPGYVQPPPGELRLEQYLTASYDLVSIKNGFRILRRKQ